MPGIEVTTLRTLAQPADIPRHRSTLNVTDRDDISQPYGNNVFM